MKLVKGAIAFGDGPAGAALDKLHSREKLPSCILKIIDNQLVTNNIDA
jgi:hypothetical protein